MLSVHSASKQGWQDLSRDAKRVSISPHRGTATIDSVRVAINVTGNDVAHEWLTRPEQLSKIYLSALILTVCKMWCARVVGVCRDVQAMRLSFLDNGSCCVGR